MKNIRKTAAALAVSSIIASSVLPFNISAADTALSKTSITLSAGEKASISLENASGSIKWQISDANVFSYSKGTVTAKGEGSAYLYAINNGKKYKCLVTVSDDVSSSSDEKASAKDSGNSVSMSKGETVKLSIPVPTNNIKISSNNSKICSLSCGSIKNGTFTLTLRAKNEGETTVSVINAKTNKVCQRINVIVGEKTGGVSVSSDNSCSAPQFVDSSSFADDLIDLVNEERAAAGLDKLEKADVLMDAADIRVKEIQVRYSHTRPDGSSCFTVVDLDGSMGENIAQGFTSPESVMKAWMKSQGHRKNILASKFSYIGTAYDSKTGSWVQIFWG